jgi:hypothetical protein
MSSDTQKNFTIRRRGEEQGEELSRDDHSFKAYLDRHGLGLILPF